MDRILLGRIGLGLWLAASMLWACGSNGSGSSSDNRDGVAGSDDGSGGGSAGGGATPDGTGGDGAPDGTGGGGAQAASIVINELMPSNSTTVADDYGAYPDWIELYNSTDEDVELGGYYVSDNPDEPERWALPQGLTIEAKGYLLLWADGDTDEGDSHLPFKLSKDAEAALLSGPDGTLLDSVEFLNAQQDYSFARFPNAVGEFAWCSSDTAGDPNPDECPSGSSDAGS